MRGEFSGVRQEIIDELIASFNGHEAVDSNFYHSLFRDTIPPPQAPTAPAPSALSEDGKVYLPGDLERLEEYKTALALFQHSKTAFNDATSDESAAWEYFQQFILHDSTTEAELVKVIESAFVVFEEFGGDELANHYYSAVERFVDKYSLRYDLRRPLSLHPTLPGIFSRLIREMREITVQDATLSGLMHDFEECVRDLKAEQSPRKIRQCLSAQFNLLEALLRCTPEIVAYNAAVDAHNATASKRKQRKYVNTFGAMCGTAKIWPHKDVLASARAMYHFGSDYPGIRHGGTPGNKLREIDMRDMIAMTIVLAGFMPYFSDGLRPEKIYLD